MPAVPSLRHGETDICDEMTDVLLLIECHMLLV